MTSVAVVGALLPMPVADTPLAAARLLERDGYHCSDASSATSADRVIDCDGSYGSTARLVAPADEERLSSVHVTVPAPAVEAPYDRRSTARVLSWLARPVRVLAQGSRDREALHNYVVGRALDMRWHRADLFGGVTIWMEPPGGSGGLWSVTATATEPDGFAGVSSVLVGDD